MANALGQDASHYYIWRASNDFAIHLSINAVTQISAQIARASSHSRNGELRGILLGRTADDGPFRATVIEDFELIPSSEDEAATQDAEDTLLEIACRKVRGDENRRVLGFVRSRRDGRLNMGSRDREIFSRLFSESGNVALLIQTSKRGNESDAALYYWEHGGAHPRDFGFGFPFDAGQLVAGHPGWRFPDPLDDAPTAAALPEVQAPAPAPLVSTPITDWTMPPPPVPLPTESSIRWSRLAPTIVLVALAIWTIQLVTNPKHPVVEAASTPTETAAPETPEQAPPVVTVDHFLGLTVTSKQHQLEIRWNRESAAITGAQKGQMKITEDGITEALPFDPSQLRDGYVAYAPKTNDVSIRLEVTAKDGSTKSESIRSVAIP
ncbi:MAG TPA: hypothetical protein VFW44_17095 [Bryobacteraceae bacterium]|nr:hypothetical protein [Bryobacteraceae bacterium]